MEGVHGNSAWRRATRMLAVAIWAVQHTEIYTWLRIVRGSCVPTAAAHVER